MIKRDSSEGKWVPTRPHLDMNSNSPPHVDEQVDDKASLSKLERGMPTKGDGQFSAELAAALEGSHIPRWSRNAWHLYLSIFVAICCSYEKGFDSSLMTGIAAMKYWQRAMKVGTGGPIISAVFSIYTVGAFCGGPPSAWVMDRFGRRVGMATGSAVIIVGSVIAATATTVAQFIVGRFLLGFGSAVLQMNAPSYAMEVAPPQWRGRSTALYNCGWYAGAIPAAAITFGTSHIKSNLSWQLPVIFQCIAAVVVIALCPFIPESPRFQMAQGKDAQAEAFLVKYHGNGNAESPLVKLEIEEFRANIEQDSMGKRWWDYRGLFSTHASRWRMIQVIMMSIFGQFSGNGLAYFATVIYKNIGVTSVTSQLGYNLMYTSLCTVGCLVGALLTDRMPRRKVLTFGTLFLAVILAVFVGLNSVIAKQLKTIGTVESGIGKGAIAVYMMFGISCAFVYTPLQATVVVEALSTTMRAKGLAFSNTITQGTAFINLFAGPIGLANIGYYYVMFFVFWDCFEAACWWFFGVESRGRTLEELDQIYEQPNPVRASKQI